MAPDYDLRPPSATVKRWKKARKNYLKWYDGAHSSLGYGKSIINVVAIMNRLYSTKGTLYR